MNVAPDFMQEVMLDQLLADMEGGRYVSAAAQARNILKTSELATLRPELIQAAKRTAGVLEAKGYSEVQFLQQMLQKSVQDAPCPPESVPFQSDGSCPPGYFPLFADLKDKATKRCCVKFREEIRNIESENLVMKNTLKSNASVEAQLGFEKRFIMNDAPERKAELEDMIGVGITPHLSKFMERYKFNEIERIEKKIDEIEAKSAEVESSLGISAVVYDALKRVLGTTQALAKWLVTHDLTYYWIAIYIFRFLSLFACIYIRVTKFGECMGDVFYAIGQSWYLLKPGKEFLARTLMPNIMSVVVSSALIAWASKGIATVGSAINGYLFQLLGVANFFARVLSMLQLPGFVMDVGFLFTDIINFGLVAVNEMRSQVSAGNFNPYTIFTAGVYKGTESYCDTQFRSFLTLVSNWLGDLTKNLFLGVCKLFSMIEDKMTGGFFNVTKGFCGAFETIVEGAFSLYGPGNSGSRAASTSETLSQYIDRMVTSVSFIDLLGSSFKNCYRAGTTVTMNPLAQAAFGQTRVQ